MYTFLPPSSTALPLHEYTVSILKFPVGLDDIRIMFVPQCFGFLAAAEIHPCRLNNRITCSNNETPRRENLEVNLQVIL